MFIGRKNREIVVFNKTHPDLIINATVRGITLDSIEETDEEIVSYYNTQNDGVYFKASEVPAIPPNIVNASVKENRRVKYSELSDPITNQISVLRDMIEQHDYVDDVGKKRIDDEMAELYVQRKNIRQQIVDENTYVKEIA